MAKKEKTKVVLPPETEPETELTDITLEIAQSELAALTQQFEQLSLLAQTAQPLAIGQIGEQFLGEGVSALDAEAPSIRALRNAGTTERVLGLELDRAASGVATPEQAAAIRQSARLAIEAGSSDIQRATETSLQAIRRELAPSLGLRSGDSPILDRGFDLGEESLRQQSQLVRDVRSSEQQALIQASLQQGALNQGLLGLTLGAESNLAQRAFQNRLALTGLGFQSGLGFGTALNLPSALSVIQQPRLASKTVKGKINDPLTQSALILGGIGGALSGGGASIGSFGGGSGGGGGGGGGGAAAAGCWVAAVHYGWHTPEWQAAYRWVHEEWPKRSALGRAFRALYLRYGERAARLVERFAILRRATRPLFDRFVQNGKE